MKRLLPLAVLLLLVGCESDSPTAPLGGIATNHTEVRFFFEAWVEALEERDINAYAALLEESPARFGYFPYPDDLGHFRWLAGRYAWDRDEELSMVGNLFSPAWVSPGTGETVEEIVIDLMLLQATTNACTGEISVIGDLDATVLWAADAGTVASVRLLTTLAWDGRGFLRIRRQTEILRPEPRSPDSEGMVSTTWARLKGACRDPHVIPTDHTDPAALLEAWELALEYGDMDAYTALLEEAAPGRTDPGFRYYPQSEDLIDFPWIQDDSWDCAEELGMIGHISDPEFFSPEVGETVDSVVADLTILGQQDLGGGEIEVDTSVTIRVLWAGQDGARSGVRLVHVLAPDGEGFLRIREQREHSLFGRSVEDASWGAVKNLYR